MKYICLLLLLCGFDGFAIEINAAEGYRISNTQFLESDSLDIEQVINASGWQPRKTNHIPSRQSSLWLKLETDIPETDIHQTDVQKSEGKKPVLNGLYISLLGSFELYLGNELVHRSGVVSGVGLSDQRLSDQRLADQKLSDQKLSGKQQAETPGNIDAYIILPEAAQTPGKHIWYLRISRDALPEKYRLGILDFNLNTYNKIITQRYQQSLIPLVSLSVFFTIAVYYFCLWFGQRYPTNLVFSLLCLVLATWLLAENWRPLLNFPYDWQGPRLWFISVCAGIFGILLPVVFLFELKPLPPKALIVIQRWWPALLLSQLSLFVILHSTLSPFDLITGIFITQGYLLSFLIIIRAILLKIEGCRWLGVALLVCILAILPDPFDYLEQWFFLLFPLVILALLYRQSIGVRQLQESRDKALIQAETSKLQLLKKSIQPHFLLNTLTSLTEWIEQSPDIAVEMVEQLAEEFYLLSTMVDKPLVSLSEEIKLCQIHLQLMSLRTCAKFNLKTLTSNPHMEIPPGILHTQIENAFSHNQFAEGEHLFEIVQTQTLMAHAPALDKKSAPDKSPARIKKQKQKQARNNKQYQQTDINVSFPIQTISERTGTRAGKAYIENRLQQAFVDNWQMTEQVSESRWQSHIVITSSANKP